MKKTIKTILITIFLLLTSCNKINNNSNIASNDNFSNINDSQVDNNENIENEILEYNYFQKEIKIYINPSVQYTNLYAMSYGNEGFHMNKISNELVCLLTKYTNITVYSNNSYPGKSLSNSVKESNSLNVDYHLAIHSNAGGGKGSEGWHTKSSKKFTQSILNSLDEILPYKTRGLKDGQTKLYELKNTIAKASLIEILFHDDPIQAEYIVSNHYKIALAIYEGILTYFKK